jgi:hypothetical protein
MACAYNSQPTNLVCQSVSEQYGNGHKSIPESFKGHKDKGGLERRDKMWIRKNTEFALLS